MKEETRKSIYKIKKKVNQKQKVKEKPLHEREGRSEWVRKEERGEQ